MTHPLESGQHPLTDEICKSIAACYPYNKHIDIEDCGHIHDMRSAADWQLEEVIEWIEKYLSAGDAIAEDLRKAMRPQEN